MDKQKQIEELMKDMCADYPCNRICDQYCGMYDYAERAINAGYRKIPENAVVINKDENPCLSCPVPEDIQRDVDCSTICGSVRLGIDWQNQCKVLVKENKQLTKALAETRKETADKLLNKVDYESNGQTKAITDLLRKEYGVETK